MATEEKCIGFITREDVDDIARLEARIPLAKASVRRAIDEQLWTGSLETDMQIFAFYAAKETDSIIKDLYERLSEAYGWPDGNK